MTGIPDVIGQRYDPHIPVDQLTEHPANPNEGDAGAVCESLDAHGFYGAVLVQESTGIVFAGNTRLRSARSKGMAGIPGFWCDVDDDTRDRILSVDNEATRKGRNDEARLVALLTGLAQQPRGLEGTGFDGDDLDALIAGLGGPGGGGPGLNGDPDDVPEPPAEPVSALGDLYLLGPHRLLCGDAADITAHDRLLAGQRPDVLLMDPPYGMRLDTDFSTIHGSLRSTDRAQGTVGNKYEPVIGDHDDYDPQQIIGLYRDVPEQFWWGADYYAERLPGRTDGSWLVWDKRKESQAEAIGSEFELCWSRAKHKRRMLRHEWFGFLSSESPDEARHRVHPTQKPCALYVDILSQWGREGSLVLDTYGGSGTTVLACHRLGMLAAVMELSEVYTDVIAARWERATGIKPERVLPDGTTEPVTFTGDHP